MKDWVLTLLALCIYVGSQAQSYDPMYANRQLQDSDPMYAKGLSQSNYLLNLRAGAGLAYAGNITGAGLLLTGICKLNKRWEVALAYSHFYEKEYPKVSLLDVDLHYVFHNSGERFQVYMLSGLSFLGLRATGLGYMNTMVNMYGQTFQIPKQKFSDCLNFGVGINTVLNHRLNFVPELKLAILEYSQLRFGATLQYKI